jgi:hypothetical protein
MKTEPVAIVAAVQAVVAAVLTLLLAFGVDLSDAQTAAILGVYAAAAPLAAGFFVRSKVSPVVPE